MFLNLDSKEEDGHVLWLHDLKLCFFSLFFYMLDNLNGLDTKNRPILAVK